MPLRKIQTDMVSNLADLDFNTATLYSNLSVYGEIRTTNLNWLTAADVNVSSLTTRNNLRVSGDVTVSGNLSALGNISYIDTNVIVTSAMSITNTGTGPALAVNQTGPQPVVNFQDDGVSAFFVDGTGNVGIGTTSPTRKLQVVGDTTISGNLTALSLSASQITVTAGTATVPVISPAGDTNTGIFFPAADTIAFSEGGVEGMRIDSSGRVGISNTSPSTTLDIGGNLPALQISATSDNTQRVFGRCVNAGGNFYFGIDSNTGGLFGLNNYGRVIYSDGSYPIAFFTNTIERLRIDSIGNVGIGTSSPATKLHVGSGNIRLDDNQYILWGGNTNGINGSNASNLLSFYTNSTERLRIDSSGNVGVGVTPSTWGTSEYKAIQVGIGGSISGRVSSGDQDKVNVAANVYHDGSVFKYIASDDATIYQQTGGIHIFSNAPSGTAGNTATFTERLRIDSSGRVGIGTSSPAIAYRATLTGDGSTIVGGLALSSNSNLTYVGAVGATLADFEIWNSANGYVRIGTNNTERLRIDSSGNVGIGGTPSNKFHVIQQVNSNSVNTQAKFADTGTTGGALYQHRISINGKSGAGGIDIGTTDSTTTHFNNLACNFITGDTLPLNIGTITSQPLVLSTNTTERLRIDSSGNLLVGKVAESTSTVGFQFIASSNKLAVGASAGASALFNRNTDDGDIVQIAQDGTVEGTISVNGTTVSYNGGHLARFSQLPTGQRDESIKKGTVLSNLDAMCEWRDAEGNLLPNEQLNKVKVSDVEGDINVAGVFVNWDNDDQDNPFDLNMAMTGDMIVRIAQGVSVNRGDLLMSAGDGTAKPQGDDVRKSKTIAKVTSTNVTCTYEDGSYCVPCVLMAC